MGATAPAFSNLKELADESRQLALELMERVGVARNLEFQTD